MTDLAPAQTDADILASIKREKELLAFLKGNFDRMVNLRRAFEQQWYTNIAFYKGRQWVTWAGNASTGNQTGTMSLVEPPSPRWRVRLVSNKIKPMIRNEFTKLTKEEPQFYVRPATTDESDLAAARAGEMINEYLMDQMHFNRRRRQATLWCVITGTGYLKIYYNEAIKLPDNTNGCTVLDVVTPFHLFVPDLQCEDIEGQPFITQAGQRTPAQIKDTYGVEVSPDSNNTSAIFEQRLQGLLGIRQSGQNKNMVYVKETWIKPCGKFPDGKMIVWCDTKIIYESDGWPYQHGRYPYVKIDHVPTPGSFYASSVIDDVIPIQKEYNKTRSQLIESKNRMSMPQLLAPKGSVDPKKITSEPGLIIEYQPGFAPPTPLQLQPVPGYVIQELDRLQMDIDDLSGQYEVSKGRTPPGVQAASAIAYLQEENDSRLHHTVASIEEAVQEVGFQALNLVQQFWDQERMVSIVSENGSYEAQAFKGSDLSGNVDLRIEPQSMAPRSRAARQAFITELMKMGAIPMDKGLQYLQMSDLNSLYSEMQVDKRHADRENWKMSQLVPPQAAGMGMGGLPMSPILSKLGINMPAPDPMSQPENPLSGMLEGAPPVDPSSPVGPLGMPPLPGMSPDPNQGMPQDPSLMGQDPSQMGMPPQLPPYPTNPYDNDDVHIEVHQNYQKTQEYDLLDPAIQAVILNHVQEHRQKQAEAQQMMQQQQMQGDPNAGTGPNVQQPAGTQQPVS